MKRAGPLLWAMVLVAMSLAVVLGASPARARAASSTSSSSAPVSFPAGSTTTSPASTTTTVPVGNPQSPYAASFVPCASDGTGPCDEEPSQVELRYPPGAPPPAIAVDWVTTGRSAGAPDPDSPSATLAWADGTSCGTGVRCWPWPSDLTDGSFILNGSYQVAPCGDPGCNSTLRAVDIGVAVRPGAPTQVQATSSGPEVTLRWRPPASAPPDLVGYTVARNGATIDTCSTDDLGPGAGSPCPASLTLSDHPGDGSYAYTVTALRLGVNTDSGEVVSSTPAEDAGGVVLVPGSVAGPTTDPTGSSGVSTGSGKSPIIGSVGPVGVTAGPSTELGNGPGPAGVTGSASSSTAAPNAGPENLSYPDDPVVGKPSKLALKVNEPGPRTDIVPVAVLALGILVLAIAAHFLYLRVEVGIIQARMGSRSRNRR